MSENGGMATKDGRLFFGFEGVGELVGEVVVENGSEKGGEDGDEEGGADDYEEAIETETSVEKDEEDYERHWNTNFNVLKSCANIGVCFEICKGFVINLVKPELVNEGGGVTVGVEVGGCREIVDRAFSTDANDVVGHFAYTVVVGGLGVFDGGSMLVGEVFGRYGVALIWVVLHFDTACAKGFELAGKEGGECFGVHF